MEEAANSTKFFKCTLSQLPHQQSLQALRQDVLINAGFFVHSSKKAHSTHCSWLLTHAPGGTGGLGFVLQVHTGSSQHVSNRGQASPCYILRNSHETSIPSPTPHRPRCTHTHTRSLGPFTVAVQDLLSSRHVDVLCRDPLVASCRRAAGMLTRGVKLPVWPQVVEQQRIALETSAALQDRLQGPSAGCE